MKTYYAILELDERASPDDIRRAYRRLVLLTHPDRTTDPTQHRRYLAVNEAYETLGDRGRRLRYDAHLARQRQPLPPVFTLDEVAPKPQSAPTAPRRGFRIPFLQNQDPKHIPLHIRYAAEIQRALPRFRMAAYASLLCVLLVAVDFNRTEILPDETVQETERVSSRTKRGDWYYFRIFTENTSFKVNSTIDLAKGDQVMVEQTPWFGKVKNVTINSGKMQGNTLQISNFDLLWSLAVLVAGSAVLVIFLDVRPDRAFNLGFANSLAAFFMVVYLFFV
ncbi:J domain-containing protein [Hymenobacter sp. BT186]|uniref:J domain-containing protein n=1 Tax=Hymenobacter telluris TaxID=2816474 RepID=A0A939ETQ1_9BACT|nr:J domain-containing protein [Hymenobacter telluris]MBO0356974.1 J domain-containing protein [Hymenobacter telluris]MBW3373001.1 J domain-containing protein [Hymenobacter norwichensis]